MSRAFQAVLAKNPLRKPEPLLATGSAEDDHDHGGTLHKHEERLLLPSADVLIGTVSTDNEDGKHEELAERAGTTNRQPGSEAASLPASQTASEQQQRDLRLHTETLQKREHAMRQALDMLCKLAALDTADYQSRLVDNALPRLSDDLDTPHVARLMQSVHRLHASVANLQHENEAQVVEIRDLHRELRQAKRHEKKLDRAVQKLIQRNDKLKAKVQGKESIAAKIMQQMQHRVHLQQRKQEEDFLKLAKQVQQHEINMVHLQRSTRARSDSVLSDIEGYPDMDGASSVGSILSLQSLVTDDGIASVRIDPDRNSPWHPSDTQNDPTQNASPLPPGLELPSTPPKINPPGTTAPSNNGKHYPNDTMSAPSSTANISSAFSALFNANRAAHPYTLSTFAPVGLQFIKVKLDREQVKQSPSLNSAVSAHAKSFDDPAQPLYAFLVCGYNGFDSNVNVKPTLGARLLSIDKELVPSSTTVEQLHQWITNQGRNMQLTFRNDAWNNEQREQLALAVQQIQEKSAHLSSTPTTSNTHLSRPTFLRNRVLSADSVSRDKTNKNMLGFFGLSPSSQLSPTHSKTDGSVQNATAVSGCHPESPPCIARDRSSTAECIPGQSPRGAAAGSVSSMLNRVRTRSGEAYQDMKKSIAPSRKDEGVLVSNDSSRSDALQSSASEGPVESRNSTSVFGKMFGSEEGSGNGGGVSNAISNTATSPKRNTGETTTATTTAAAFKKMFAFR